MPLTREQPTVLIREVFAPQTQVGFGSGRPPGERPPAPFGNGQEDGPGPFDKMEQIDFALLFGAIATHLNSTKQN